MMASSLSKADGMTPIITFISMIVLGIVISEFIIKDQSLQLPIILFFFVLGMVLAGLEMRAIIGRSRIKSGAERSVKISDEDAKDRLARYVADLFEEDIPFDELDEEKQRRIDEMNSGMTNEDFKN